MENGTMEIKQRRLKIAMVSDTANGAAGAGAVVSGQLFADRLKQKHDVIIVSADDHADVKLKPWRPFILAATGHEQVLFAVPNRKTLRKAFADVDVIHLHLPFWLSFVALDEARKAGKPVVASFHVQPENMFYNLKIRWSWLNRTVYRFWVKKLWNRADLVLCPSLFAVKKLQEHNLKTPTKAISNGSYTHSIETQYEREDKYQGYFTIFMLGRLAAEKEQSILLRAVRRSKYRDKIKVVIAGRGQCEKKLAKLAARLPNGAEIGFVTEEQKNQMLATADLFVHCSSVELEGMAVLEAMGAGLPVLVAEGPETAASHLALENFRFPVGNINALKEKIDWLIENPMELKKAGQLYQIEAKNLDIEKTIREIEGAYHSVCNSASF